MDPLIADLERRIEDLERRLADAESRLGGVTLWAGSDWCQIVTPQYFPGVAGRIVTGEIIVYEP